MVDALLSPAWRSVLLAVGLGAAGAPALAVQEAPPPSRDVAYRVDTGAVTNATSRRGVVASFEVRVEDARWLRLFFERIELAGDPLTSSGATLRVTAFRDGAVQELQAYEAEQWSYSTAYFNGDAVLVELVASPRTGPSRLVLDHVVAGLVPVLDPSQCGATDDRVLSTDPRAARLLPVGCTGWLIDDCAGCMLTAGHCTDGGVDVAQFNVPLSNSDGSLNHPPPEDQYAVDATSEQNLNAGVGQDWGYFGVFPNSITGLRAADAQGAVYTLEVPPTFDSSESIRITGYGTDSSPFTRNQVQQTHVGPWFDFSGTALEYQTDTTGGNSGSPVIHEETGVAIGIHTHGGCSSSSGNSGTSAGHAGLQNALADPRGVCMGAMRTISALPEIMTPGASFDIDVQIPGGALPGTAKLYARYDGGAFLVLPMTAMGGDLYRATLPPPVCSAAPEFYLESDSAACGLQTLPANAPQEVYTAAVGTAVDRFDDDMEANFGWQAGFAGDDATTGIWTRVDPRGTAAQPEDDHTSAPGILCWVTGQGSVGGSVGENDVDGGRTTLVSPVLDATGPGETLLRYWRWYSNDQGSAPNEDVLQIDLSSDSGATWTNAETVGPSGPGTSGGWIEHVLRVADFVTPTAQFRVRVVASDLGSGSIVEAAIDDVRLYSASCDVALADCNGNGILDSDDIASGRSGDANGDGVPDECTGGPGIAYCFCASGAPCGNVDAGAGCANSTGSGAELASSGTASVVADDLVLTATSVPANQNGIFFMGGGTSQTPFGDGQRCVVGGGMGVSRFLPVQSSGGTGMLVLGPGIVARSQSFPGGGIQPGETWNFQSWFRDPAGPCGTGFNLSHGMAVLFQP